jgi:hypothetical protein
MSECLRLSRVLYEEYNRLYPGEPLPEAIADDLAQVVAALHRKERSALCLSGGGIRSATFGLGVIQGLAKLGTDAKDSVLSKLAPGCRAGRSAAAASKRSSRRYASPPATGWRPSLGRCVTCANTAIS